MGERVFIMEMLPTKKRFTVELKDANREKRNRSYANASPCHSKKLKQKKFCEECNEEVTGEIVNKIVKIGKHEHLVPTNLLEQATDRLGEMEEISVHTILKGESTMAKDYYDNMVYAYPAEKRSKDYVEMREILKGKTAIGKGVFRNNEFQVLIEVGEDGVIRIRKLVEEAQHTPVDKDQVERELNGVVVNEQLVAMERRLLEKGAVDAYDFSDFKDTRAQIEESIIEQVVVSGVVPAMAKPKVVEKQEADELAILQEALGE